MRHLFIALSPKGYGETILGIRIAKELNSKGESCSFIVHESSSKLLIDPAFECVKINDKTLPLLGLLVQSQMKKHKADSIILSDYFTTALSFERANLNPDFFNQFECPIGAIDTWDIKRTGNKMDFVGKQTRSFKDWTYILDYLMTPVPVANPNKYGNYYSCLPEPGVISKKVKRHIRRDLGISDNDRIVLFCTAEWQHSTFKTNQANQLRDRFPLLLSSYLKKLNEDVLLVHVGPARWNIEMSERYCWIPPLPPDQFELLLGSADLLLTANVSSTTISKAIVSGVPVINLVNSSSDEEFKESILTQKSSKELIDFISEPTALHPFYMWPIGYHSFLKPILKDNPYCKAVPMLEITNEEMIIDNFNSLLFNSPSKQLNLENQLNYVKEVERLPSAAELIYNQAKNINKCRTRIS